MKHMLTPEQVRTLLACEASELERQIAAGALEPAAAAGGTLLFNLRDVKRLAAELRRDAGRRRAGARST